MLQALREKAAKKRHHHGAAIYFQRYWRLHVRGQYNRARTLRHEGPSRSTTSPVRQRENAPQDRRTRLLRRLLGGAARSRLAVRGGHRLSAGGGGVNGCCVGVGVAASASASPKKNSKT